MLGPMTRLPRALFLFLFMSCASPLPFTIPLDVGSGGSGGGAGGGSGNGGSGDGGSGDGGFSGVGVGGSGGAPGDGGADAIEEGSGCAPFVETYMPSCATCLGIACCDVATACFAVPDCFGYASCQQNCPPVPVGGADGGATNVCLQACAQNFPGANPAFGAMTACLHQSCAGVCPY